MNLKTYRLVRTAMIAFAAFAGLSQGANPPMPGEKPIDRVEQIRKALLAKDAVLGRPTASDADSQDRVAQWYNFPNFPNWPNWGNWQNWSNMWRNF